MGLKYRTSFILGFVCCLLVLGCAGASFKYYGLAEFDYNQGVLLGPKPKDDLPFSRCAPTGNVAHPCIIMFSTEFFALKQDYEDTKQKLKECQKTR